MKPKIAVIGRVGVHHCFEERGCNLLSQIVPKTPFGPSVPIYIFDSEAGHFAALSRHGEQGYAVSALFVNDRANLWALKNLGVEKIFSWSAPGSIDPAIEPGSLVVPHDVLEWVGRGASDPGTFFKDQGPGVTRAWPAFCPEMREALIGALASLPLKVHPQGVYAATTGPRLETAAEIEALSRLGASLVGMTLCPELWLARELEFCYAAVCYSVNFAEGVRERPFVPGVLFEGLATEEEFQRVAEVEQAFPDVVLSVLPAVAETPRECPCPRLLERYRRRGDLKEGWWRYL